MKTTFRDLGAGRKKPAPKEVKTSLGIVDFVPTFNENDTVKIKKKYSKYSTEYMKINHLAFSVAYCKVSDLGNMVVEVVYFKEGVVNSPCLVEHFELIK